MCDVTDERYSQAGERFPMLANGQDIEQPLSGMLMRPVTCVDHAARQMVGKHVWRAG